MTNGHKNGFDVLSGDNGSTLAETPYRPFRKPPRAAVEASKGGNPSNVVAIPVIPKNNPYQVPETAEEYIVHAKAMIADLETVEELMMWWHDEMGLRNKLNIPTDVRISLMQLIAERREELS